VFAFWEVRVKNAMLPLGFFKNMSFTGANMALTFVGFALMGCFFFLGQYLLSVVGYTPLEAGVRLLPMAGAFAVAAVLSARVARRIATKYTVALGIIIATIGFFYLSQVLTVNTSYGQFVLGTVISALGMGLTISPATNSVMGSIPVSQSGVGSGMNNTTRQVGGALGVAVLGTLMNSSYIASINKVSWPAQLPVQVIQVIRNGVQEAQVAAHNIHDVQLSTMINNEARTAFTSGMTHALVVASFILAVVAVITIVILPAQIRPPRQDE
jgi:predicted MFS family arabinose efflux permease